MKRISLPTIIVFVLLPSVANAYYSSRVPLRYRVRYCPYAFSYTHPSGLVPGNVRYNPYAFSYKHPSGLISDYWSGPYYSDYALGYRQSGAGDCDTRGSGYVSSDESADLLYYRMRQKYEENLKARDERIRALRTDRQEAAATTEINGGEVIRQYLTGKNVDFQMNRVLRIGDRMVSADFLLKNKNLLIKYWNPAEVQIVSQDSGYKKNIYEKYRQMCSDFGRQFRQQGGKIYQIESADAQEILAKLKLCGEG
jgi:hypothetical protein